MVEKKYFVDIKGELDEKQTQIINDYWAFLDGKFINKTKNILQKHRIKSTELYKIIENSTCKIIHGKCVDCGKCIETIVNNQTEFSKVQNRDKRECCSSCSEIRYMNYINERLAKAKNEKRWRQLSNREFNIFKMCIDYNRSIVFTKINERYPGHNFKDINKLKDLDLIYLRRDNNSSILEIIVPKEIENEDFIEMYYREKFDELTIELKKMKDENIKLNYLSCVIDKGALETIKDLAVENVLLRKENADLKKEKKVESGAWVVCDAG